MMHSMSLNFMRTAVNFEQNMQESHPGPVREYSQVLHKEWPHTSVKNFRMASAYESTSSLRTVALEWVLWREKPG
jgi:hypothetical protein